MTKVKRKTDISRRSLTVSVQDREKTRGQNLTFQSVRSLAHGFAPRALKLATG